MESINNNLDPKSLGFESVEEMQIYHDLCRGDFKDNIPMTKELCARYIADNKWGHLLSAPRDKRLRAKLEFDFCGLLETIESGLPENIKSAKQVIDYELKELEKYYDEKYKSAITDFGKGIAYKSFDGKEWSTMEQAEQYNKLFYEKMKIKSQDDYLLTDNKPKSL